VYIILKAKIEVNEFNWNFNKIRNDLYYQKSKIKIINHILSNINEFIKSFKFIKAKY
jgi:hypothetical protein